MEALIGIIRKRLGDLEIDGLTPGIIPRSLGMKSPIFQNQLATTTLSLAQITSLVHSLPQTWFTALTDFSIQLIKRACLGMWVRHLYNQRSKCTSCEMNRYIQQRRYARDDLHQLIENERERFLDRNGENLEKVKINGDNAKRVSSSSSSSGAIDAINVKTVEESLRESSFEYQDYRERLTALEQRSEDRLSVIEIDPRESSEHGVNKGADIDHAGRNAVPFEGNTHYYYCSRAELDMKKAINMIKEFLLWMLQIIVRKWK